MLTVRMQGASVRHVLASSNYSLLLRRALLRSACPTLRPFVAAEYQDADGIPRARFAVMACHPSAFLLGPAKLPRRTLTNAARAKESTRMESFDKASIVLIEPAEVRREPASINC